MSIQVLTRAKADFITATETFHEQVDLHAVLRLQRHIQERRRSKSTVFLTGVGKSMNLASHIADMLKSIGIKAVCIDPTKALHGDSGMITDKDMVMGFSKSGGTKEVVRLLRNTQIQEVGCLTVACVCNPKCDMVRVADDAVVLPVHPEVDPGWNLVPTVSSSFFMNLGNLLVASILFDDNYALTEYAKSHPGGSIGQTAARTMSGHQGPICKPVASLGSPPEPVPAAVATPLRNVVAEDDAAKADVDERKKSVKFQI